MFSNSCSASQGMIRLKHCGLKIEVHAVAPINCHEKIGPLRLKFDARPDALQVFAELSAATVDVCQKASTTKNGILFEIFWVFQSAKSWDLKRSSPAREMFTLSFNGTLIHHSDCALYFDQVASIIIENLQGVQPRKRRSDSEDMFIQATACITCAWDDTYKIRGACFVLLNRQFFPAGSHQMFCKVPMVVTLRLANGQPSLKHAVSFAKK